MRKSLNNLLLFFVITLHACTDSASSRHVVVIEGMKNGTEVITENIMY